MLMPKKHISLSESVIGFSTIILKYIKQTNELDDLYKKLANDKYSKKSVTFDYFILCVNYLYMLGIIEMNSEGGLVLCV